MNPKKSHRKGLVPYLDACRAWEERTGETRSPQAWAMLRALGRISPRPRKVGSRYYLPMGGIQRISKVRPGPKSQPPRVK